MYPKTQLTMNIIICYSFKPFTNIDFKNIHNKQVL